MTDAGNLAQDICDFRKGCHEIKLIDKRCQRPEASVARIGYADAGLRDVRGRRRKSLLHLPDFPEGVFRLSLQHQLSAGNGTGFLNIVRISVPGKIAVLLLSTAAAVTSAESMQTASMQTQVKKLTQTAF